MYSDKMGGEQYNESSVNKSVLNAVYTWHQIANMCNQQAAEEESSISMFVSLHETVVPVLFGLIIVIGVIGNVMVLYVILRHRQMRTSLNVLLMNLAVADLGFLIFCVPLTIYHYASPSWGFGEVVCRLSSYPLFVSFYVTMYTLILVSIWRYVTVTKATHASANASPKRAFIYIIFIWIFMALANIPTLFTTKLQTAEDICYPPYTYCGATENLSFSRGVYLTFFVAGYVVPLTVMTGLYMGLVRYVKQHTVVDRTQRITKLIVLVVVAFSACWLPLHVHLLLAYFGHIPSSLYYHIFRIMCQALAYSNCCMNPFIYNLASKSFREGFLHILPLPCKRKLSKGRPTTTTRGSATGYELPAETRQILQENKI